MNASRIATQTADRVDLGIGSSTPVTDVHLTVARRQFSEGLAPVAAPPVRRQAWVTASAVTPMTIVATPAV